MRRSPAADFSSPINCRSVCSNAASGMLLTRPMSMASAPVARTCVGAARVRRRGTSGIPERDGFSSSDTRMTRSSAGLLFEHDLFRKPEPTFRDHALLGGHHRPLVGRRQRLVEIADDVVAVLDADAQPDHLRLHAGLELLLR